MSAAEDLADLIRGIDGPSTLGGLEVADAILAAGYRKPPTIDNDKLLIKDGMLLLDVGSCTCTPYGSSHEPHCGLEYLDDLTKPLERAGYRKLRTVTTVEELDALPENTVIRDSEPATLQLIDGQWFVPGHDQPWYVESIDLPVTVIHEPS